MIEIKKNENETIKVFLSKITNAEIDKVWKFLLDLHDLTKKGKEDLLAEKTKEYNKLVIDLAMKCTGVTQKEWDNLSAEESNKVIGGVGKLAQDRLGFTKL